MGIAQEMRSHYNAWDGYEGAALRDLWIVPRELVCRTIPYLNGSQKVLDAGCGTGLVGKELRRAGYSGTLVGVDIAERRLVNARKREAAGVPVYDSIRRADLYHLPWKCPMFDAVLSSGVLGLIGSPVVNELLRVLRPGGLLSITVGYSERAESKKKYSSILHRLGTLTRDQLTPLTVWDLGTGYAGPKNTEHYDLFVYRKAD